MGGHPGVDPIDWGGYPGFLWSLSPGLSPRGCLDRRGRAASGQAQQQGLFPAFEDQPDLPSPHPLKKELTQDQVAEL